jgi:hypothetical protein
VDNQAKLACVKDLESQRLLLGVPPFAQGPGDISTFASIFEFIRKLVNLLMVGRCYSTQESLSTTIILSAFTDYTI